MSTMNGTERKAVSSSHSEYEFRRRADDVRYMVRRVFDALHRIHGPADNDAGLCRTAVGLNRNATRLIRTPGGIRDIGCNLVERCGGFLQRSRLLLGPPCEVVGALADFPAAAIDGAGRAGHLSQCRSKLPDSLIEIMLQLLEIRREGVRQFKEKIAGSKAAQPFGKTGGRLQQTLPGYGLRLFLQTTVGYCSQPENLKRRRHLADLVSARKPRHGAGRISCRKATHGSRHRQDRPCNRTADEEHSKDKHGDGHTDSQGNKLQVTLGDGSIFLRIGRLLLREPLATAL